METTYDSWLEYLVKHPIFDLDDAEKRCSQTMQSKQTRQDSHVVNYLLQHHARVMAVRDNDLFVAIASHIRVLNLSYFKDNWLKAAKEANAKQEPLSDSWMLSTPYKILDTPEINYNIGAMTPNSNGRLLAVCGEHRLEIVCLPRQSFSDVASAGIIPKRKVDCRTLSVGGKYYHKSKAELLKIQWHPLSETHTHIVVLGNDSMLRIFDISCDIEVPEQSFDLSPLDLVTITKPIQRLGSFSVDDQDTSDEDVVSFTLGGPSKDKSGWEPFSVFYVLRNGHMYSLCPVIPFRSVVRRSHLDNLACISDAKYQQAKSASEPDHKTLSHLFNLHSIWIDDLFQTAKIARRSNESDSLVVVSDEHHSQYPVLRQGPFVITHTEPLSNGVEATDLLLINADPVYVLALGLTNGSIHNYLLSSEIDAQWRMPVANATHAWQKDLGLLLAETTCLPKASLYEVINLKTQELPAYQTVTLMSDPLYEDTYFIYHATGVHAVAMSTWIQPLRNAILKYESGNNPESKRELDSLLKDKSRSEVRSLVNASPFKDAFVPIIGLVLISDIYLSYSLLALTSDYRLVTRDLNVRSIEDIPERAEKAVKAQLHTIGSEQDEGKKGYEPLLSLPLFKPPPQLDTLPKQPKIVLPPGMSGPQEIVINEETLRFFSKSTEQIRRETRDLKKAASHIDGRLTTQQKEFERQLNAVRDLYFKLQKTNSKEAKEAQQQKLKDISQKHAKLRLRIDEQLRTLMKSYQPELSNEEKEWIDKLEKLSKQVSGESGYLARIKKLREQLEQQQNVPEPKAHRFAGMNQTQLKSVLGTLKQQSSDISTVAERMEKLESKLSASA
ncbi:hypothetical protein FB192DRAFT_1390036 [Mucor lusitanicus]|uniref:Nucleoporin Nup82 n=2 Tax=Mucor circinelloides f. lusitanicus TaxID=29924 RepID=A0A162ZJF1_MUCCL|nr:hypothetical protein FB192DRAFT_1390036 [Mucor lusitanicus]OAD06487.1 hypothetical protein MUCCIDRAFT_78465 [Mucor lusitanicus CBS 277.49]